MAAPGHLSLRSYGASPGSHAHDHFQVLVGLEGVLELEVEGRGRRIGAGDGFLVAPGDTHDFESAGGSRCLVLDTRLDLWSLCAPAPARAAQMLPLASYLAQALLQHQPLAALHGPALLLEAWKQSAGLPQRKPRRRIDWAALAAWTQMRLHTPLTVADLAAQVHLSPSQFALRCHEAHGMSAMQWLRRQRLDRAQLLRDAGLPVADVARRTGYRSPSALTAAMRRAPLVP
ncbi:MAG: AraC family transcriptional regulator [Comamonadaceae bacterium]|nr:MAG: AraC family transcriptional regulator [Comamonadaceae bacterium]